MSTIRIKDENTARPLLGRILNVILIVMALGGGLRFYGALNQRELIAAVSAKLWLPWYLIVSGLAVALVSALAIAGRISTPSKRTLWAGIGIVFGVGAYWIERLLLWSPDQRGGNIVFMAMLHLLCLAVLGWEAIVQAQWRKYGNGSGN